VEPEPVEEPEPVVEPVEENNDSSSEVDEDVKADDEEDEADDDDDDDEEKDDDGKKRHHLAWLWILFLLLAALGALGYIFKDKLTDYYHQWRENKQSVEQVVEPEQQADVTAEPAAEEVEPAAEEPETVEEPVVETYTPEVLKQTADGKYDYIRFEPGHYYAIAGSFPVESDVERHIRHKNLDQYSPKIVLQDGVKNLRVCIGIFDTEEEAEQFAKGVNPQYWVLK
jgi:hypothetical protein